MSDVIELSGGGQANAEAIVSADQESIIGDGTQFSPLRGVAGNGFQAQFFNPFADPNEPRLGKAVVVDVSQTATIGRTAVRTGSAGNDLELQFPQVIGLLIQCAPPGFSDRACTVQSSGIVTLTAEEWSWVIGGDGVLVGGKPYYLTWSFHAFGGLVDEPPPDPDMAFVQVGVALNQTSLLLSCPSVVTIVA